MKINKGQPRTRRIPGPAQCCNFGDDQKTEITLSQQWTKNNDYGRKQPTKISLINKFFWQGSWLQAMIDCQIKIIAENNVLCMIRSEENQFEDNLSQIKKCNNTIFKINKMIVLLKEITILKEAIGIMIDPFDEIKCLMHRECFPPKHQIHPGCVLILQNVSIMHSGPTKNDYYVCVTNSNINKIYSTNTKIPKSLFGVFKQNNKQKCVPKSNDNQKLKTGSRQFVVKQYINVFDKNHQNKNGNNDQLEINVNSINNEDEPLHKKRKITKSE